MVHNFVTEEVPVSECFPDLWFTTDSSTASASVDHIVSVVSDFRGFIACSVYRGPMRAGLPASFQK